MKRNSLFLRLLVGNLLLVGGLVTLVVVLSYRAIETRLDQEGEAGQDRSLTAVRDHFKQIWEGPPGLPRARLQSECQIFARVIQSRLTLVDAKTGEILADSELAPEKWVRLNTPDRPEIMDAIGGRPGRDTRRSRTTGVECRFLARPIQYNQEVVAVIRSATPLADLAAGRSVIRGMLWWSILTSGLATLLLGLFISWVWYSPVRHITHAARSIASGDLSARANVSAAGELSQLAGALNEMRENLARQIELSATQREDLQAVISNLREGVLGAGTDGRVILANQSAIDLLMAAGEQPVGRPVQQVVRVTDIVDLYNRAASGEQAASRQVEIDKDGRRHYLDVHAMGIPGRRGEGIAVLLVVRDVTDIAAAANMKAEFVANASHELRTPVATIRATVDTLAAESGDREALAKYIAILDRHCTRLETTTRDLLDLHILESGRRSARLEKIAPDSIVQWVRQNFVERAVARGITFEISAENAGEFTSDRALLELVIQNLLENAIKFTPSGGVVRLLMERHDSQAVFSVSDTGCGIPAEAQGRVFERFFQVSTSRGGGARGSGLGLAIVKHACERLGAAIDLQSEVGQGTTITVFVPDMGEQGQ